MLLKFFKQTLPQVIIVMILIAILLWLGGFWAEQINPFYFDSIKMPFYSAVTNWVQENSRYGQGLAFLMMIITALYLLQINSKHIVIKQRTYLPAFFYILLVSSFIPLQRINPAVFSAFFLIFTFDHIFAIYHKEIALDNIFKAGFFIAIASLFYAPSILYFIALLLSIMSIRSFNFREWIAAIFGLITPWFFYFLYQYIVNSDLLISFKTLNFNLFTAVNQDNDRVLLYVFYAYCILLFLVTGWYLLKSLPTQKINVRNYHGVFFWFNLVSLSVLVFIPTNSFEIAFIAAIPLTFQFAHYFTSTKRKFWPEFLFFVLILLIALMQFY